MQVLINHEVHEVKNAGVLGQVEHLINHKLSETGLYFSHLVIDGVEVFNEFEEYFNDYSTTMKSIEVILLSGEELTSRAIVSVLSYLDRALPEVNQLINLFYMKPVEETWSRLEQLLEGLGWIQDVLANMNRSEHNHFHSQLSSFMPNLEEGLKYKDTSMIADIIQYEIYPLLNSLRDQLQNTVDNEVVRHDLN